MTTDGRGPHYQIFEERFGNGPITLLPHHEMEHLFWTDFEKGTISYTDYQGGCTILHEIFETSIF